MFMTGIARIGNEPVLRTTASGQQVLDLSLAFNYGKKTPEGDKPTQWISASIWGDRAAKVVMYLRKGNRVYVRIDDPHVHQYEKDGQVHTRMRGTIGELEFIEPRVETQSTRLAPAKPAPATGSGFDDMDSDIPF